jgi:hypothetical protein
MKYTKAQHVKRKPTEDDIAGMQWWNAMTEQQRSHWLQVSKSNVAQHAWDFYKQIREVERQS